MLRDGAIIFRDLVSKLDVLDIEWDKSGRVGIDTTSIGLSNATNSRQAVRPVRGDHGRLPVEVSAKLERLLQRPGALICRKLCNVWGTIR
jgi:hypothetical protein